MEWYQYYWRWLSTAFSQPWAIWQTISGIFVIIGGVIALITLKYPRWRWSVFVNRLVWVIPLCVFGFFFLAGLVTAPYKIYLEDQTLQYQYKIIEQRLALLEKSRAVTPDSLPLFPKNEYVILSDAADYSFMIKDRGFDNCAFFGPSNIHFNRCSIENCFLNIETGTFIVITTDEIPKGTVIFENCVIRNCRFYDISIIGTYSEIKTYKANFILD